MLAGGFEIFYFLVVIYSFLFISFYFMNCVDSMVSLSFLDWSRLSSIPISCGFFSPRGIFFEKDGRKSIVFNFEEFLG